ncbi:MAG: DUF3887 domain-containing protein [Armatimonadetes bacterium]|nr:DUF3887 domain-containing protein [Armatimonadota bacterium]NIM24324.1 DUF3887 domain-containing protein [Armatimonadota bacterium]NIM68193.1 DUF3887 domain-containing protein [Armatimonadota bacterium]NIM76653.1 DUF3887 domain-containing protein [Armatimonadota bacterium]NIN06398.1 DUF3887 domain-containing protein [Armatimonadota bacterium]
MKGKKMIKRFFVLAMLLAVCVALASCGQSEQASDPGELTEPAKRFVMLLAEEDFTGAVESFDATMREVLPAANLKQAWSTLVTELGAFENLAGARTEKEQGFEVVYVTCEFERGSADIKVAFDGAQRISGLWFVPPK